MVSVHQVHRIKIITILLTTFITNPSNLLTILTFIVAELFFSVLGCGLFWLCTQTLLIFFFFVFVMLFSPLSKPGRQESHLQWLLDHQLRMRSWWVCGGKKTSALHLGDCRFQKLPSDTVFMVVTPSAFQHKHVLITDKGFFFFFCFPGLGLLKIDLLPSVEKSCLQEDPAGSYLPHILHHTT